MGMKAKISLFLATALITSGVFIAFSPSLTAATTTNLDSADSLITMNNASSRAFSTEVEDISKTKITSSNMTWPNDVYALTGGGYDFWSQTQWNSPKDTIFTVNNNGLVINPSYPKYSFATFVAMDKYVFEFPSLSTALKINAQSYDINKNAVGTNRQISSIDMHFGNISGDNLAGYRSVLLSRTQPYFKIKAPLVFHNIEGWKPRDEGRDGANWGQKPESYVTYVSNKNRHYDGEVSKEVQASVHWVHYDQQANHAPISDYHRHTALREFTATLTVYNDYSTTGGLLGTYLFNTTKSFNSVLPKITVSENLLNKDKTALDQNLNQNNLFKISDGQYIPNMGGYSLTAEKNIVAGKITFTYKPKFVFENSILVPYEGAGSSVVVSGFNIIKTFIALLDSYDDNIVVDRFIKYVTVDGVIDSDILGTFLDLSSVPPDVTYEITNPEVHLVSGVLNFKITSSNCYDVTDNLLNRASPAYTLAIQLTPRITKIGYTDSPDNILVTELYDRIFDENGLVNLDEFNKFAKILAPVDEANYYLIPDTYDFHTGDGTASFKIYADKFYNSNADETEGGIDVIDSHFTVTLKSKPLDSIMQVRNSYATDIRVDKFITSLGTIGDDGVIADLTVLKQYINFENIPSTAKYKINNINYADYNEQFITNEITFDLTVTDFNQVDGTVASQTETITLTLGDQHMQTGIVMLDTSLFPKDVTRAKFVEKIEKDGATIDENGVYTLTPANIKFLEKFFDFNSIPDDTVFNLTLDTPISKADDDSNDDSDTELLNMTIAIDKYYDSGSDLVTDAPFPYTFGVNLASEAYIPQATYLATRENELFFTTEQEFLAKVYTSETEINLDELDLYVEGLESVPVNAKVLSIKHKNNLDSSAVFSIELSGYYDGKTPQMQTDHKEFNFEVGMHFIVPVGFDWWWILIATAAASTVGALIWVVTSKRKQAEALQQVQTLAWLMTIKDQQADNSAQIKLISWLIEIKQKITRKSDRSGLSA